MYFLSTLNVFMNLIIILQDITERDRSYVQQLIDRMADDGLFTFLFLYRRMLIGTLAGLRTIALAYREFSDTEGWTPANEDDDEWEPPEVDLTLQAILGIKVRLITH